MGIDVYSGISQKEIEAERKTSEGKSYTINHPDELVISMRYIGESKPNHTSQGWERSGSFYYQELKSVHPEFFSMKNSNRIENGESPKVDAQFVKNFPQYKGYENEVLIHHHIGGDGQAVAVPSSIHKGSGEIHNPENNLGITKNAQLFSEQCKQVCSKDASFVGKTSNEFKTIETQNVNTKNNAFTSNSKQEPQSTFTEKGNAFTKTVQSTGQGVTQSTLRSSNGAFKSDSNEISSGTTTSTSSSNDKIIKQSQLNSPSKSR